MSLLTKREHLYKGDTDSSIFASVSSERRRKSEKKPATGRLACWFDDSSEEEKTERRITNFHIPPCLWWLNDSNRRENWNVPPSPNVHEYDAMIQWLARRRENRNLDSLNELSCNLRIQWLLKEEKTETVSPFSSLVQWAWRFNDSLEEEKTETSLL